MKRVTSILVVGSLVAGLVAGQARAGDREWAVAGKVLAGLAVLDVLTAPRCATVVQQPVYYAQPGVYSPTVYYPPQPVYYPQAAYNAPVYYPQAAYNAPVYYPQAAYNAPVYYPQAAYNAPVYYPPVTYRAPVYYPQATYASPVYYAPAPVYYPPVVYRSYCPSVSFGVSFGWGGYRPSYGGSHWRSAGYHYSGGHRR